MCGICGVARTSSGPSVQTSVIERMRDTMVHRGPDGAGTFVDEYAGLGHRRLSIVDVAHGHQPMFSENERLVIAYNGEVFNHPQLQPMLEAQGVHYRTRSDTETVLHLYERHGDEAPTHLRGMFAIAVWDRAERKLWLARDRFGVKPLYYVHGADGTLWFASEIKALLAAGAVAARLNEAVLPDFLANHAPSGDETLFAGVRRLPPGHTLTWQDGRITIHRYWQLSYAPSSASSDDARSDTALVDEFTERFTEAVRLRLMSDVPLGMFLSGGIDSAAITAVMSGLVQEPVKSFSVAFAEREANEFEYARLVAEHCRTEHHEIIVSPHDFFDALPKLLWHEDEPIAHPSSIALNFVSQLAARHVKVVLTGEGSDETLAGYNRYRVTIFNQRFGAVYGRMTPAMLQGAVRQAIGLLPSGSRTRQRAERTFLMRGADLDSLYFDNFAVFGRAEQQSLLTVPLRDRIGAVDPYSAYHHALDETDARTLLDRLLYADTRTYLHELLMKQDQMSMAASIESRVPFLDHPLVEWVSRLPHRAKLRGVTTKWILRQAMQHRLPARILERRKMGFPVPVGTWLRGAWRPLIDEYVLSERSRSRGLLNPAPIAQMVAEHVSGNRNHSERLWALITLEMWQRIFLDGDGRDMPLLPAALRPRS
ncbi:MAG: asparagine synthase (glutamine-hydrolyzing) [Gemmatimonas sp.]